MKLFIILVFMSSLIACNGNASAEMCDSSKVTVAYLLAKPEQCLGKQLVLHGYTPGIPSLLFDSQLIYKDKKISEGVYIDLFELDGLNDCVVGNVEVLSTVTSRGQEIRLSNIKSIHNADTGQNCFSSSENNRGNNINGGHK